MASHDPVVGSKKAMRPKKHQPKGSGDLFRSSEIAPLYSEIEAAIKGLNRLERSAGSGCGRPGIATRFVIGPMPSFRRIPRAVESSLRLFWPPSSLPPATAHRRNRLVGRQRDKASISNQVRA